MVTQPEILATDIQQKCVVLSIRIPENLHYFEGHFDNTPILPGVVQLHWAIDFLKSYFKLETQNVIDVEVLKFKVVTLPRQHLVLTLAPKKNNKFTFVLESDKGLHSSGRVVFEEAL